MAQVYTANDVELRSSPTLKLSFPSSKGFQQVEFQFPPKIRSNNMSGEFKDVSPKTPGLYPQYAYAGPNERSYAIETVYIVDSNYLGGQNSWTANKIKRNLQIFRQYFFDLRENFNSNNAGVKAILWDYGGSDETTFFIRGLSIKHSDTYISDGITGVHPLRTDLSFELVLWWNYEPLLGIEGAKDGLAKVELPAEAQAKIDKGQYADRSWY